MEIHIGISEVAKPIVVILNSDTDGAELRAAVEAALRGEVPVLRLDAVNGSEVIVASSRITYIIIGSAESQPIGFG